MNRNQFPGKGDGCCGFIVVAGFILIGLPILYRLWKWGFGF